MTTVAGAKAPYADLRSRIEGNLAKSNEKQNTKATRPPKPRSSDASDKRGKKRSHDGSLVNDRSLGHTQPAQEKEKDTPSTNLNHEELKTIMVELGGTEEDLALIDGADSDSDMEGQELREDPLKTNASDDVKKNSKSLQSGMANILKELALARSKYEKEEDSEVELDEEPSENVVKEQVKTTKTAPLPPTVALSGAATKGKKSRLLCEPRSDWFNYEPAKVDLDQEPSSTLPARQLEQLHAYAKSLLETENVSFKATQQSSSSQAFYNTVISSGTLSDKISALTLAVQESPLHNMKSLEGLLGLAKKRSRSQAVDVLRALKDLLAQGSLLPSDRKLFTFSTQPALIAAFASGSTWSPERSLPAGIEQFHIVAWAFEDWLKEQYFEVLKVLENWCNDEIEFSKSKATSYVYELLREKPEQEANLLRLLINKLGDPVKKIASQASYLVMQLLATHPAMKEVVISAINTDFIFKPGQTMHARYYAAVTLNQTALSVKEENIALILLDIYFGLFKALLKPDEDGKIAQTPIQSQSRHQRQKKQAKELAVNDQEVDLKEKLISAILTGVNRAYPYSGTDHKSFNDHIETLFQITHSANFNTSVQAMMLIQQLIANTTMSSDRFYRTLYESLLDPRLISSSKQQLYLNLLHRSLKADVSIKRVKAFVKRILQILNLQEPSFVCGTFFLLKDLEKTFPSLSTVIDTPEDHEDGEETFRDVQEGVASLKQSEVDDQSNQQHYDGSKRAPEHANADGSCAWEILPFLAHYHPSVTVSADHIIDHKSLPGKPDLNLHTMIHFLDRFVYKNAKLSSTKMRGSSIMQPMANDDTKSVLVGATSGVSRLPVNSEEFRVKKDSDVAADDVFFHQYFKNTGQTAAAKKAKQRADFDDAGSFGSADEDEVWNAMMESAPDLDGLVDDEDEDDEDMEDFEAEMDDVDGSVEGLAGEEAGGQDDDDGSVDIEAGIFDDLEDEIDEAGSETDEDVFEGLDENEDSTKAGKMSNSDKAARNKETRARQKKFKAMPTFASAADYAKMLDDNEGEDIG